MAIETEKNAASGNQRVAGVETSMAELKNQVEGLEGLDSNFASMREDFRVALNTLSGDLKREIHDLRDSFMDEIMTGDEEMEKYLKGVNVVDDASKIKIETRYLNDTAALWWRRRYGDIERGVQDISTAIAHVEALIDFSTRSESSKLKDRKVNQEKGGREKNALPKVDAARKPPIRKDKNLKTSYKSGACFICDGPHRGCDCPKKASMWFLIKMDLEHLSQVQGLIPLDKSKSIKIETLRESDINYTESSLYH
nr:putative retrotransposon Gag domain, aspartic peptidase domain protein [Tanacetum cinerariifolium]